MLPPGLPDRSPREEFVQGWLEQRMAKETAERIEQAQQALEEQPPRTAQDAERQAFVKRWLELRMERESCA
jgi:hypothetical protein